jgi:hypothetical protein
MKDQLSARVRKIMSMGTYTPRVRPADEAPPRTFVPLKWEPPHPDLQFHTPRPDPSLAIKSRGDI